MKYINEQYHNLDLICGDEHAVIYRDGKTAIRQEAVLVEHLMDVYVNEVLTMKLVCTPENLAELVLGRLFTEGIIAAPDDVEMLYVCEHGSRARVVLRCEERGGAEQGHHDRPGEVESITDADHKHGRNQDDDNNGEVKHWSGVVPFARLGLVGYVFLLYRRGSFRFSDMGVLQRLLWCCLPLSLMLYVAYRVFP